MIRAFFLTLFALHMINKVAAGLIAAHMGLGS